MCRGEAEIEIVLTELYGLVVFLAGQDYRAFDAFSDPGEGRWCEASLPEGRALESGAAIAHDGTRVISWGGSKVRATGGCENPGGDE